MTVIVQQPTDSNGNPQPMVYDSDTGKIIVDHDGYVINGSKRLVNVPTVSEYVNSPKTTTAGIQEALNYGTYVVLREGSFLIYEPIVLPKGRHLIGSGFGNNNNDFYDQTAPPVSPTNIGAGSWLIAQASMSAVITTNGNLPAQCEIRNLRIESNYLAEYGLNLSAGTEFPGDAISGLILEDIAATNATNVNIDISHNADIRVNSIYCWTKNTSGDFIITNVDMRAISPNSEIDMTNLFLYSPYSMDAGADFTRISHSIINSIQTETNYMTLDITNSYIANEYQNVLSPYRINIQNPVSIYLTDIFFTVADYSPVVISSGGNATLSIKNTVTQVYSNSAVNFLTNNGTLSGYYIDELSFGYIQSGSGTFIMLGDATISGTTAGTISLRQRNASSNNKRVIFYFNGYENNTTTDQTIDFPLAFTTISGIIANTTGLTISTTTSGITITAPDSTTTYSGILIIEGY